MRSQVQHTVRNNLQAVTGFMELGDLDKAKEHVRKADAALQELGPGGPLLQLVERVRMWETHTATCAECRSFDDGAAEGMPCHRGATIIRMMLQTLTDGI